METKHKELYESPAVEIVELKAEEGILQASLDEFIPTEW